ncbi:MAG: ATP-binding protein, partial [Acidimicrobiia bacterium]
VTLTGPGGTGKTRLALRAGAEVIERFRDGVWFVDLASITDPDLVPSAIAETLGLKDPSGPPLLSLARYLSDKEMLLVLDNFEQVPGASPHISRLLREAPMLRVLVTSRAALHLYGEQELPVPPLEVPPIGSRLSVGVVSGFSGVGLFVDRARAVQPAFAVTEANASAVATIAYRLDGLPLAIELAAARVKVLNPEAILARLGQALTLLSSGAGDLPARQQTLRGAISWSYHLLTPLECRLFERMAVFMGGATVEAIEAVCGPAEELGGPVLDGLARLVDHSLVVLDPEGARFRMLETIREFALERLEDGAEAGLLRRRHAEALLAIAEEAAPHPPAAIRHSGSTA